MEATKTGQPDIVQCVEEIVSVLKKHGMSLRNTEIALNKVNLAIKMKTPVFGDRHEDSLYNSESSCKYTGRPDV